MQSSLFPHDPWPLQEFGQYAIDVHARAAIMSAHSLDMILATTVARRLITETVEDPGCDVRLCLNQGIRGLRRGCSSAGSLVRDCLQVQLGFSFHAELVLTRDAVRAVAPKCSPSNDKRGVSSFAWDETVSVSLERLIGQTFPNRGNNSNSNFDVQDRCLWNYKKHEQYTSTNATYLSTRRNLLPLRRPQEHCRAPDLCSQLTHTTCGPGIEKYVVFASNVDCGKSGGRLGCEREDCDS